MSMSESPQVDLYLLKGVHPQALYRTVCRLAEKAFGMGHRIYIHAASQSECVQLDDMLWTFKDGSFIPHAMYPAPSGDRSPVLIGHEHEPRGEWSLLINLRDEIPAFFQRFQRIAEIVDEDPHRRAAGRRRYAAYRDQDMTPTVHELS